jgi:hypothetical protein
LLYSGYFWSSENEWVPYYYVENIKANVWRTWNITKPQEVFARDTYLNESHVYMTWTIRDVLPTIATWKSREEPYHYTWVLTWQMEIAAIEKLWWDEWSCWPDDLVITAVVCDTWYTWEITQDAKWIEVTVLWDEEVDTNIICEVRIEDNEHLVPVTWYIEFRVDTKKPHCDVSPKNNSW